MPYLFSCFRELKTASREALVGRKFIQEIGVDKVDKSLVANFDILNLVPEQGIKEGDLVLNNKSVKGKYFYQTPNACDIS